MRFVALLSLGLLVAQTFSAEPASGRENEFQVIADQFADIQILRYRAVEFDQLSLQQKKLAYYLTQAGLAGRDIFFDQKYKHNLTIRKTLEAILSNYTGDREAPEFRKLEVYAKRFFFSNGLHHHYSNIKFIPECSPEYFEKVLKQTEKLPLKGKSLPEFTRFITPIIFDPAVDAKLVDLSPGVDNVKTSAVNFYEGVTKDEVNRYYEEQKQGSTNKLLSFGLNSKVLKENGQVKERRWTTKEMYAPALQKVVFWLKQAVQVAENEQQKKHLRELIAFYETGDLERFDRYCIEWVKETEARIDVVNGFIEVYQDPLHRKGSFESVVSMKDMEASKRIASISSQAQWFEDNSPIASEHKKKNVTGISAKVITVLGEVGGAAPSTPVGDQSAKS